jgi:DNA replication protein DnaC
LFEQAGRRVEFRGVKGYTPLVITAAPQPDVCPRCNSTGWIPMPGDSRRVEPCGCQGDLRRRQRLASASIPRRYVDHCTLNTFYDKNNGLLKTAKQRVQEFIDAWPGTSDSRGLLLLGGPGAGKTHLAVAALVEIINSGKPGKMLFCNFQDLIQEVQMSFDSDQVPRKSELMAPLLDVDLLVLDELGSQKPTTFVQDILYYVINSRYNEKRVTIFTTNYVDTPADAREENLTQRIGPRLRSRIYEMADMIPLMGVPDHRVQNKQSRNII